MMTPAEAKVWAEWTPRIDEQRRLEKEALDAAFVIGAPDFVDGVPIRRMTLADWMLLVVAQNAYMVGGEIKEEDVYGAMWILSLGFDAKDTKKRDKCIAALVKNHDVNALASGLNKVIETVFLGSPLSSSDQVEGGKKSEPMKVGFAATIIHTIASRYNWSRAEILKTPLCELFQYLRMIETEDYAKMGKEYPQLGGKSDAMIMQAMEAAELAKQNERKSA